MAEKIVSMKERISSKLRMGTLNLARQHARHYKARRLGGQGTCMWDGGEKKCGLGPKFLSTAAGSAGTQPTIKAFALKVSQCLELKKDACTGDCAYKNGRCDLSEGAGQKLLIEMIKASSKDCGPIMQMFVNSCEVKSKADCTGTCEYHENGDYEFDEKSKSCKQKPVCKKKKDPNDPSGIKAFCPDADAVKKECDAKGDRKLKMDCYGKKCPVMLMLLGGFACAFAGTEETCLGYDKLCAFDGTKSKDQCSLNQDYVLDLFIPKTCWMRPLMKESRECEKAKTEDACQGKCFWQTQSSCDKEQVETTKKCEINPESLLTSFLGPQAVRQQELCTDSKTESSCTQVTAAPYAGNDGGNNGGNSGGGGSSGNNGGNNGGNSGGGGSSAPAAKAASDDSSAKTLVYAIMIVFVGLVAMV